jgi:CHAT domain-containing protein/tetratricopeptide (TPR) repeat protein
MMVGPVAVFLAAWSAALAAQATKGQEKRDGSAAKLPLWQHVLTGDDATTVEALEKRVADLEKKGQFAEAIAPMREVVTIRSRVQGRDHWETIDARLQEQTWTRVSAFAAGVQAELAMAIRKAEEAEALKAKGRYAEAKPLLRDALEVRRRVLGDDQPETAAACDDLATDLRGLGEYAEAESLLREALTIRLRVLGPSHPATASSYGNLAVVVNEQGRYAEAEPDYRRALAAFRDALGEEHPTTVMSSNNLAVNLNNEGRYTDAEPLFRRGLALTRRARGEDDPGTAAGYNNLAVNLDFQGKHGEAQALFEKALAIKLRVLREDHPDTALGYDNLAVNLNAQGKYTEADRLYRKALAIFRRTLGESHPNTLLCLNNQAANLGAQQEFVEAERAFRKALKLQRRALGEDHPSTAVSYNSLAGALMAQGRHTEAQAQSLKALEIRRRALGEGHPRTALSYTNLIVCLIAEGKYPEAEAMGSAASQSYESARLRISATGLDRAAFASTRSPLTPMAALLVRRGRGQDAWQRWEADLARGLLDDLSARRDRPLTAEERRLQDDLAGQINRLDNQIAALTGSKPLPDDRHQRLDDLKNRRLDLQGQLVQLEAELVRRYQVAAGEVYGLDRIRAQLPAEAALVGWLDLKTQPKAADRKGDHWACIVRRTGVPMWLRIAGTGSNQAWTEADADRPDQVRKILGAGPSPGWQKPLAELAEQRLGPLDAQLQAHGDLPRVRHLIVLSSAALAGIPIEALLEARPTDSPRYLVSYAPSGTTFAWLQQRRRADPDPPAQSRRLLALGDPVPPPAEQENPSAPKPPGHGLLVRAVPPGSNAATGGIQPGDVLLSYAGTKLATRDDLRKQVQAAAPKPAGVTVTVWREGKTLDLTLKPGLLGVQFETQPAGDAIRAQRAGDALLRRTRGAAFAPLPGTRSEVQAIAALFHGKDVFVGSDASEQLLDDLRIHDKLSRYSVVHLAAHCQVDDLIPMNSRLFLSQDRLPDPTRISAPDQPFYDGTLTAGEVMSTWKLNAELVVLSACQSGLGRSSGGEGFIGFAQAFFLAGGRSLVLSLWEVDDRATSLLMTRFYQNWLGKRPGLVQPLPKAEALREAKAWLRGLTSEAVDAGLQPIARGIPRAKRGQPVAGHPFEHPHYWAGFILMGDPN